MMFTEGLDESAISWIKQGSDVKKSQSRSPLTDKLGEKLGLRPTLIRGLSKENLRIEVPGNTKRFIDGDSMFLGSATSLASGSLSNCQLRGKVQPHSAYATPIGKLIDELGTPSAPPIIVDIGTEEHHSEVAEASGRMAGIENVTDEINTLNDDGITIQASNGSKQVLSERINSATFQGGQNAWQVLLAYDACIRLCLNSWARGCTEAPEFLRDECKLLRSAFGWVPFYAVF
nr:uncharacterized protein LOC109150480 isoform X3 [Ipomoea batatas]